MDAIKIGRKGYILQTNLSPKNLKQLNDALKKYFPKKYFIIINEEK